MRSWERVRPKLNANDARVVAAALQCLLRDLTAFDHFISLLKMVKSNSTKLESKIKTARNRPKRSFTSTPFLEQKRKSGVI